MIQKRRAISGRAALVFHLPRNWSSKVFALEQIPERLVIDRVVELYLGALDNGSQLARAAVGRGLLQLGIAALHVGAQNLGDPGRRLEVVDRLLNVVWQISPAG